MGRLRSPVILVALTLFLNFAGLTLAIPLLPFWAEHLGATPPVLGGIVAAYALPSLAFAPVLGTLSDRFGRKPIVLTSLLLSALSFALTALASSLAVLLLARIIGGLGASVVGAAQAIVSDQVAPRERARAMGTVGAAIGLGHVVGPALGGTLSTLGPTAPFWVAMILALSTAGLVWVCLPEIHRPSMVAGRPEERTLWSHALGYAAIRRLAAIGLVFALALVTMETVLALFTNHVLGWTATENGWLYTYIGVLVALVQVGLIGRLTGRFGEWRLLAAGLGIAGSGYLLLSVGGGLAPLIVALGLVGLGSGLVSPILPALLSIASPRELRGGMLGFAQAVGGIGRLLGPLVAGGLFTIGAGLPFLVSGLLCLIGVAILFPRRNDLAAPLLPTDRGILNAEPSPGLE